MRWWCVLFLVLGAATGWSTASLEAQSLDEELQHDQGQAVEGSTGFPSEQPAGDAGEAPVSPTVAEPPGSPEEPAAEPLVPPTSDAGEKARLERLGPVLYSRTVQMQQLMSQVIRKILEVFGINVPMGNALTILVQKPDSAAPSLKPGEKLYQVEETLSKVLRKILEAFGIALPQNTNISVIVRPKSGSSNTGTGTGASTGTGTGTGVSTGTKTNTGTGTGTGLNTGTKTSTGTGTGTGSGTGTGTGTGTDTGVGPSGLKYGIEAVNGSSQWTQAQKDEANKILDTLPDGFRSCTKRIIRESDAAHPGALGWCDMRGNVYLADCSSRGRSFQGPFVHEMTHNFQAAHPEVLENWKATFWPGGQPKTPSTSAYGNSSAMEDMAESVRSYWQIGPELKRRDPARYEFIKTHIMSGKEFGYHLDG